MQPFNIQLIKNQLHQLIVPENNYLDAGTYFSVKTTQRNVVRSLVFVILLLFSIRDAQKLLL
jgi:hypothetical protein